MLLAVVDTILLAAITILMGALLGTLGWIGIRLVGQLDSASQSCATLTTLVDRLEYRMDEHEKWHSYRKRASDAGPKGTTPTY